MVNLPELGIHGPGEYNLSGGVENLDNHTVLHRSRRTAVDLSDLPPSPAEQCGSITGTPVYSETHSGVTTDEFGLVPPFSLACTKTPQRRPDE